MPSRASYYPVLLQSDSLQTESQVRPTTVLLHGLWAPTLLMRPLQWQLRQRGHRALLARQRDWALTPAANANALAQWLGSLDADAAADTQSGASVAAAGWATEPAADVTQESGSIDFPAAASRPPTNNTPAGKSPLHLVGHSLGGIVLLHLMAQLEASAAARTADVAQNPQAQPSISFGKSGGVAIDPVLGAGLLQRIVSVQLVACPCQGSAVARRFASKAWRASLLGKSVHQGVLGEVPAWTRHDVPLGVIRGTRSRGLGHMLMRTASVGDGVLSLPEADTAAARDRADLPASHSGLLFSSLCADYLDRFVRHRHYASAGAQ